MKCSTVVLFLFVASAEIVFFLLQCCEWRVSQRGLLLCGPAACLWDHPSGKAPVQTAGSVYSDLNSVFVLCVFGGWTFFVLSLWMQCGSHFFYLLIFLSVSVLDLDSEQKVRCNIHQQMSLCRFHSDSIRRETLLPLGLGAAKPPWNPDEWIGRTVAKN